MDFLKELFDGNSMTYEQLEHAVKEKGFQVVNAAGGDYVPRADVDNLNGQVTTLTGQLQDANQKLEGYDPTWKDKAETARKELEAQQFDFALEKAVTAAKPKNVKAVIGLLDRNKLTYAGGEIVGLDKQISALKDGEDTAFLFETEVPRKTGMSHQNANEVGGGDRKEAANDALRTLFGGTN